MIEGRGTESIICPKLKVINRCTLSPWESEARGLSGRHRLPAQWFIPPTLASHFTSLLLAFNTRKHTISAGRSYHTILMLSPKVRKEFRLTL